MSAVARSGTARTSSGKTGGASGGQKSGGGVTKRSAQPVATCGHFYNTPQCVFFLDADGWHYLEETTCVLCSGYNLGCVCRWTVAFAVAGVILLHLRWPIECCSCNQTRLVVVRVCVPGFFLFFISGKQYWSVQHLSADGAAFKSTRTLKPMVALRHKHASLFPPSLLLPPPPYSFATINATTCVRFSSNI